MENTNKEKEMVGKIVHKIREVRKQRGYSNEVMAIDLDMSTSAYNKLERMETTMTLERFLKISEILEVSYSELFECVGKNSIQQNIKETKDDEIKDLNQENREITQKLVQTLDEEIQHLKEEISFLREIVRRNS